MDVCVCVYASVSYIVCIEPMAMISGGGGGGWQSMGRFVYSKRDVV